jgi:hypothetical protein
MAIAPPTSLQWVRAIARINQPTQKPMVSIELSEQELDELTGILDSYVEFLTATRDRWNLLAGLRAKLSNASRTYLK